MRIMDLPEELRRLIDAQVDDSPSRDPDRLVKLFEKLPAEESAVLFRYWDLRKGGCSPRLAEMYALQSPPGSNTDREFLHGHSNGNQFDKGPMAEAMGDKFRAEAELRGVSVKGKVYLGGLAEFPGDPRAWISDKSEAKRVCEERGWKCSGLVEYTPDSRMDNKLDAYVKSKPEPTGGLSNDE